MFCHLLSDYFSRMFWVYDMVLLFLGRKKKLDYCIINKKNNDNKKNKDILYWFPWGNCPVLCKSLRPPLDVFSNAMRRPYI